MPSNNPAYQRGMGFTSIMFAILLGAFALTLLFKMGPAYMNDTTLASILASVAKDSSDIVGSPRAIADKIGGHMNINSLTEPRPKDFKINKVSDYTWEVEITYERRVHLFFNVEALMTFHHRVEVITK